MDAPAVDGFIEQNARGTITRWSAAAAALETFLRSPAHEAQRQEFTALCRVQMPDMDGYLFKPIDQRSLFDAVER